MTRLLNAPGEERLILPYEHGAVTADTTVKLWSVPTGMKFTVRRVFYNNPTGLAADASNYFQVSIKNGATIAADWSTETGQEGALSADTPVEMTLAAEANRIFAAGDVLSFVMDETGTQTLPAGRVVVEGDLEAV